MGLKSLLGIPSVNKTPCPTKSSYPYQTVVASYEDKNAEDSNCLPVEINKPYLRELLRYMSDDDCSELLRAIVDAISKDENDYKISKSIQTSIIEFIISKG